MSGSLLNLGFWLFKVLNFVNSDLTFFPALFGFLILPVWVFISLDFRNVFFFVISFLSILFRSHLRSKTVNMLP